MPRPYVRHYLHGQGDYIQAREDIPQTLLLAFTQGGVLDYAYRRHAHNREHSLTAEEIAALDLELKSLAKAEPQIYLELVKRTISGAVRRKATLVRQYTELLEKTNSSKLKAVYRLRLHGVKERAWTSFLQGTNILSKLLSKGEENLQGACLRDLAHIKEQWALISSQRSYGQWEWGPG